MSKIVRLPATRLGAKDGLRVCLYLDPSRVFEWHVWLTEALRSLPGCELSLVFAPESRPLPMACALLFEIERLVYGVQGPNAVAPADPLLLKKTIPSSGNPDEIFDVVVDLAEGGPPTSTPRHKRILVPRFNRGSGEIGLLVALIDGEPPLIELYDSSCPHAPWRAEPAVADRQVFTRCLDNVLSCAVSLMVKAVRTPLTADWRRREPIPPERVPYRALVGPRAVAVAAATVARKAVRLIDIIVRGGKQWSVGWRFTEGSSGLLVERDASFSVMPDDGRHFYADPFPFCYDGRRFVFVEEFPYATGRGCISVFEIDGSGKPGPVRTVIEEPYHLSYPFIFELDGEIWMIPESGAGRGIFLYRADPFPSRWKREACLIDEIEAYDTTLVSHGGEYWLFTCEKVRQSSTCDILSLFGSNALVGDWRPHSDNPILIDSRLCRAGGAFLRPGHGLGLLRPVQDCGEIYGGALGVCRIDALGPDEFRQTLIGRIHSAALGCHTYNHVAGVEVIDVFGRVRELTSIQAFYTPFDAAESARQDQLHDGSDDAANVTAKAEQTAVRQIEPI